jgi:chemotaxis regulatin CheY-phosphate phosphatase CheZ
MSPNPPEITLELSGGSLTIRTAQAIYHILVSGGLQGAAAPALPQPAAAPALSPPAAAPALPDDDWDVSAPAAEEDSAPAAAAGAPEDEDYYRDLSHDMYREVGRLARRLSMSIRDVKIQKMDSIDFESAGQQLEQAKDQLENVVKMTEQATLRIMDLGEGIQGAIDQARRIMEHMATLPDGAGSEAESELNQARDELAQALASLAEFMGSLDAAPLAPLAEKTRTLLEALREGGAEAPPAEEPAPAPEPEPAPPAGPRFLFPLEVVFQTVYELCTNETVKKHIKAMWDAGAQGFDAAKVEEALDAIAPEAPDEDNFLNLDLKNVLKALYQATGQERFQQVLKKMASTADQIFLEQTLPLEAMPAPARESAAPAPAPAPAAAAVPAPPAAVGPDPALLAGLEELLGEIEAAASALAPPPLPGDLQAMLDRLLAAQVASCSMNVVDPSLLTELDTTMNVIFGSVNSIIEALSFQDLSGQVIYRIVRLLTDFQVSLLAMVVSFGSKLKARAGGKDVTTEQSEKMAQQEVDKVMESLGVHDESQEVSDAAKLDQDSVNNLLDNLGF